MTPVDIAVAGVMFCAGWVPYILVLRKSKRVSENETPPPCPTCADRATRDAAWSTFNRMQDARMAELKAREDSLVDPGKVELIRTAKQLIGSPSVRRPGTESYGRSTPDVVLISAIELDDMIARIRKDPPREPLALPPQSR